MTVPSYQREQVVDIINSVIGRLQAPSSLCRDTTLNKELVELKGIIDDLRRQLHAVQPGDISRMHIPSAADELDAVVGATEQATVTIMDCCEEVLKITKDASPDLSRMVEESVVRIFEACTFQDITGQRIRKVTNSLKAIDHKIKSVLSVMEGQLLDTTENTVALASSKEVTPASLLNGPALPANAVSQDDIDKLLAEFDNPKGA